MNVTFANGVSKLIFEPPDKKGKFLLVDTFKDFPSSPTHESNGHKLYRAEVSGFNSVVAEEAAPENRFLFFTEEYAKKVRPSKIAGAKFARYIPLRDNDTRKYQLDVACGYVEDELYSVKKFSDGYHPSCVVERTDLQKEARRLPIIDFDDSARSERRNDFYASNGNFLFAQVDLIDYLINRTRPVVIQPIIYEPEPKKFYKVIPVQIGDWNAQGFQEVYLNGKLKPVECAEGKFHNTGFFRQLRWSNFLGWVRYTKYPSNCLCNLRGYAPPEDFYEDGADYSDTMSVAELLGYAEDDVDDPNSEWLWEINGF